MIGKQLLKWLCCALLLLSPLLQAQPLPVLDDLHQARQLAGQRFLLVLVSQPHCSYCELVESDILKPMQRSGQYDRQLLFRKLIIHDGRSVTDLDKRVISATQLARRYNTSLTPTLLFIDPTTGKEIAEKLVGVSNIEMYGYYVDRQVAAAHLARQR